MAFLKKNLSYEEYVLNFRILLSLPIILLIILLFIYTCSHVIHTQIQ